MLKHDPRFYLAGCLKGDAWLASPTSAKHGALCLRCADRDFAEAFAHAITAGYELPAHVTTDERGYALVRRYDKGGRFQELSSLAPVSDHEAASWLCGLFDSEGNVVCVRKPSAGPRSWDRRVAMFSTNTDTLHTARRLLTQLGMASKIIGWSCGAGHKGDKPVYAVRLDAGRDNFAAFANRVSSHISDKREALNQLASTYQTDPAAYAREAQLKGAEAKNHRFLQVTLPRLVEEIRGMVRAGVTPRQHQCSHLQGYWAAANRMGHGGLIAAAQGAAA